jgi:DNA modification methylase
MKYNPQMEMKKEENKRNNAPRSNSKAFVFGENRRFDNPANGNEDYIFPKSIQKFNKEQCPKHPTQKPVALFEYLIKTYTNEGDLVLDNCIGSGTTAIAALNTGRHFIGMEKEPKYVQIARKRIAEIPKKLTAF